MNLQKLKRIIHEKSNTQIIVLDAALLSTQHYNVSIEMKGEYTKECSRSIPYTSV